jgi:hypothetical protein
MGEFALHRVLGPRRCIPVFSIAPRQKIRPVKQAFGNHSPSRTFVLEHEVGSQSAAETKVRSRAPGRTPGDAGSRFSRACLFSGCECGDVVCFHTKTQSDESTKASGHLTGFPIPKSSVAARFTCQRQSIQSVSLCCLFPLPFRGFVPSWFRVRTHRFKAD